MADDWEHLRQRIVGLGERSVRKSHYPELRRRLAELERFRALLEQSTDIILLADADGVLVDCNSAAVRQLGYAREALLGLSMRALLVQDCVVQGGEVSGVQPPQVESHTDADRVPMPIAYLHASGGKLLPTELMLRLVRFEGQGYTIAVARDVSHRIAAEDAVRQAYDALERKVEQRTRDLTEEVHERRKVERALRESEQRFRDFAESTSDWFWESDETHTITVLSDSAGQINRDDLSAILHDLCCNPAVVVPSGSCDPMPFRDIEREIFDRHGVCRFTRLSGRPVFDGAGRFRGYRGTASDVTAQRLAERALQKLNEDLERRVGERTRALQTEVQERLAVEATLRKLSTAVEQSPVSVMITDPAGLIDYVNPKFVEQTGFAPDEVIGLTPAMLHGPEAPSATFAAIWRTIRTGGEWRGEVVNRKKDGALFWVAASVSPIRDAEGDITHFLAVAEDISVRKAYEEQLLKQANFDGLTQLPNRLLAIDRLKQAIVQADRHGSGVAVLFMDLDQFKWVNDTLGHTAGDRLLVVVARRLTACLRQTDTVARFGGDEFLMILPYIEAPAQVDSALARILNTFIEPVDIEGREIYVTASIGVTLYPEDSDDAQGLMKNADVAMYTAKEAGRNTYRFFTPELDRMAHERLELEGKLRHAGAREEFYLHFQPILDARTGRPCGGEALLRWLHPHLGRIPPDRFIPLAEESGMIRDIGAWVLKEACAEARSWLDLTGVPLKVSVNISPTQLRTMAFAALVRETLTLSRLPADCLCLEITERCLLQDSDETMAVVNALADLGVEFWIDDFGTGYSSLAYLKRAPVDVLKIDKSFVQDVTDDPSDAVLTRTIITMGHSLGLKVVAEGIETVAQYDFVCRSGVDFLQGYYHSRPMSATAIRGYLNEHLRGDSLPFSPEVALRRVR